MKSWLIGSALLMACACTAAAAAEEELNGYLCCNVYTDGQEISDINIGGLGQHLIPAGSPIRVLKWKKHKIQVSVENRKLNFDNDYSRDLSISAFARRYIVAEDPTAKIRSFPKNVQVAIADGHLVLGMTRDQTLMSLGYPASSEVPNLNSPAWTYWFTDKVQYRVKFDEQDRLTDVENVIEVKPHILNH